MKGFCPNCGVDAETMEVQKDRYEKMERLMVTRCLECGCRVSWYSGGSVRIWGHGGGMVDVSEGKMIVSPGVEV